MPSLMPSRQPVALDIDSLNLTPREEQLFLLLRETWPNWLDQQAIARGVFGGIYSPANARTVIFRLRQKLRGLPVTVESRGCGHGMYRLTEAGSPRRRMVYRAREAPPPPDVHGRRNAECAERLSVYLNSIKGV